MKKEQIQERTRRIYIVAFEIGCDIERMSQFLIKRVIDNVKPTTVLEEDFIARLSGMAKNNTELINENAKGRARISGAEKVSKKMRVLVRDFIDSYRREVEDLGLLDMAEKTYKFRKEAKREKNEEGIINS